VRRGAWVDDGAVERDDAAYPSSVAVAAKRERAVAAKAAREAVKAAIDDAETAMDVRKRQGRREAKVDAAEELVGQHDCAGHGGDRGAHQPVLRRQ